MNCSNACSQAGGCIQCMGGGLLHQNQLYTHGMSQNQRGLSSQNYVNVSGVDADYQLFKQYAHLTDGELLQTFQDEHGALQKQQDEELEKLQARHASTLELTKKVFWEWCAKYRKNLTPERAIKLKVFT